MAREAAADAYLSRSRALELSDLAWQEVRPHVLSAPAVRALRYMQAIESYTIVYLRALLSTRAIDDAEICAFLGCWIYEETFHGVALARLLEANGTPPTPRPRPRTTLAGWLGDRLIALVSHARSDFAAVHMAWGAINELTTLTAYRRLARLEHHPVLSELLARIIRDEARHFSFYFRQAWTRMQAPRTQRLARRLVERFWAPVGSGEQPQSEVDFLARYLFSDPEGGAALRAVDARIRKLPGFQGISLLEAWLDARSVAS